jgi:ankyrin repeat protein
VRIAILTVVAACVVASAADTRLADAAQKSDRAAIRALLSQHADPNSPQVDGTTALHWAAHLGDVDTAESLLRAGATAKAANRYGITPLSLACTNGNGALVELLLMSGADPNTATAGGETVLMTAARSGSAPAVKALIARGARLEARETKRGQTAIMWAAAEGNVEAIETLIQAGADFRARSTSGFTAFLFAVREGRLGVVRALLKAGADPKETVQPPGGATARRSGGAPAIGTPALVIAVANAHYELAANLLDAGADPNAGVAGLTALHVITNTRKPGVGDNNPPPDGSGEMSSIEFVRKAVAQGADLNIRMTKKVNLGLTSLNTTGATPYFLAAKTADAELMRLFASLGADTSITNVDGATPLMAAAGLGTRSPGEDAGTESEVLEALQAALDLGADINAVDKNGETAMHSAAYKNHPLAVGFLAAHGAKIDIWNRENKRGWTPLTIAEGYRFGNYKPSPETVAAIQKVMKASGVPIPPPYNPAKRVNSDYK